jgi:microcystin-dependent protein
MDLELIEYIIIFIQVIAIIYLIFKTKKLDKYDNTQSINSVYNIDIDAMRNMSSLANYIITDDQVNLVGDTINMNNVILNGTINGTVMFESFNGIIVIWTSDIIPNGWAICDGTNGTPDLRSRFIVGAWNDNSQITSSGLSKYNSGDYKGEENVTLTQDTMPLHDHNFNQQYFYLRVAEYNDAEHYYSFFDTEGSYFNSDSNNILPAGGGGSHNNMPPYYALYYIMKLGEQSPTPTISKSTSTSTSIPTLIPTSMPTSTSTSIPIPAGYFRAYSGTNYTGSFRDYSFTTFPRNEGYGIIELSAGQQPRSINKNGANNVGYLNVPNYSLGVQGYFADLTNITQNEVYETGALWYN